MDEQPIFSVIQTIAAPQAATQLRQGEIVHIRLAGSPGNEAVISPVGGIGDDPRVSYQVRASHGGTSHPVISTDGKPFLTPEDAIDAAVTHLRGL